MQNLFWLHIGLSTLTLLVIAAAALQAILLAFFERQLEHKKMTRLMASVPALEVIELWLFRLITLGFTLLTLLIVISVIVFQHIFIPPLLSKTLFSILVWIIFALLLLGRYSGGWRGRTAIRWTLAGFMLIVLIYIGSNIFIN